MERQNREKDSGSDSEDVDMFEQMEENLEDQTPLEEGVL